MSIKGRRSIEEIAAHRAALESARALIDAENRVANLERRQESVRTTLEGILLDPEGDGKPPLSPWSVAFSGMNTGVNIFAYSPDQLGIANFAHWDVAGWDLYARLRYNTSSSVSTISMFCYSTAADLPVSVSVLKENTVDPNNGSFASKWKLVGFQQGLPTNTHSDYAWFMELDSGSPFVDAIVGNFVVDFVWTSSGYPTFSVAYADLSYTPTPATTAITLDTSDSLVLADGTSAAFSVTLPTASSAAGRVYTVKKTDVSVNAITIDAAGAELVDGATTHVLSEQYDSATFTSDGTRWQLVAGWPVGGGVAGVWSSGAGVPTGGSDGDFYLRTSNSDVYEKIAGVWTVVDNLTGATGATGATGPRGTPQLYMIWQGNEVPTGIGTVGGVWIVPQLDGFDHTFNIIRTRFRCETAPTTGPVSVTIEKSAGGGAFSASTLDSLSLGTGVYEDTNVISVQVNSGQVCRVNFTAVGAGAAVYTVEMEGVLFTT